MKTVCAVLSVAMAIIVTRAASAQEVRIKSSEVPGSVLAAAAKTFPKAQLKGWEKETKDGKTLFEVSMVEGTTRRQASFAVDGTFVESEEVVAVASVPRAVSDAVRSKYPKARIHSAEKITRGSDTEYEIGLKNSAKKEVLVSADGKIVN